MQTATGNTRGTCETHRSLWRVQRVAAQNMRAARTQTSVEETDDPGDDRAHNRCMVVSGWTPCNWHFLGGVRCRIELEPTSWGCVGCRIEFDPTSWEV